VLVLRKIGAAQCSVAAGYNPPRAKRWQHRLGGCSCWIGMTMGGPNGEPLGIAVLANGYWTKGQPNIIADNAGIAMLKEISAAI
jgi:hypothetical protein